MLKYKQQLRRDTNKAMDFIWILLAYLVGSIPTGVWYSRIMHNQDVRDLGSGNSGATNIGRNYGLKAAIFVTAIDVLKGWIPMGLAMHFLSDKPIIVMLIGIAAIMGHSYPIFADFRGGKIVATSIGVLLGYNFWIGILDVIILFSLMFITSMVSFAAIFSYGITAIINAFIADQWPYQIGFILIYCWLVYRHRQNISRIFNGQESHINWGLRKDKSSKQTK